MQVTEEGSVRVDLVGGTLDLEPINLILPNVVTLNVATSLKAKVQLEKINEDFIKIESLDYNKSYSFSLEELEKDDVNFSSRYKEMTFVLQIIKLFEINFGLKVMLSSGSPPGSGLGGSSAMGITLFKALSKLTNKSFDVLDTVSRVKGVEGRILNQGVPGYQDYFPALLGGILCLSGQPGEIKYEQLYSNELKSYLESHLTLVYSGISRNSGINNWDVYKSFFDGNGKIRSNLIEIAKLSFDFYKNVKTNNFSPLAFLIGAEGELRKELSKDIVPDEVFQIFLKLKQENLVSGIKMCGAGGGGCYLLTHSPEDKNKIVSFISGTSHSVLDFKIEEPVNSL